MRVSLLLTLLLLLCSPVQANIQVNLTPITLSMTQIVNGTNVCTAFAPRIRKLITASHCMGNAVVGDQSTQVSRGGTARLAYIDRRHDIAVLDTSVDMPPLELGNPPKVGDDVIEFGYGMTGHGPILDIIPAMVVNLHETHFVDTPDGFMMLLGNPISGMSGGPVLDKAGKVVGVVKGGGQPQSELAIFGISAEYEAVKRAYQK